VGATLHVGAKTPVMEIFDNEEVWVGGHLTEFDDPGLNDFMGVRHNTIPHSVLTAGTQIARFSSEGDDRQIADAIFEITML
jgi:hypothetical protein